MLGKSPLSFSCLFWFYPFIFNKSLSFVLGSSPSSSLISIGTPVWSNWHSSIFQHEKYYYDPAIFLSFLILFKNQIQTIKSGVKSDILILIKRPDTTTLHLETTSVVEGQQWLELVRVFPSPQILHRLLHQTAESWAMVLKDFLLLRLLINYFSLSNYERMFIC